MSEPKNTTRNRPISIKGLTFEETVSELLKHKPLKEDKAKRTIISKPKKKK